VLDAVTWVPGGALYEARGGPLGAPFILPDNFDAARAALTQHFPEAKDGIAQLLGEMEAIAAAAGTLSRGARARSSGHGRRSARCGSSCRRCATSACRWRRSSTAPSATTRR